MECAIPCPSGPGTEPMKPQHALLPKCEPQIITSVNPYHILQVRREATKSEIIQSYCRLALLNHPGRSYDSPEQQQRRLQLFEVLAASYECLIDDESRQRYDMHSSVIEHLRQQKGLAGKLFVGGKLANSFSFGPRTAELDTMPSLIRSDSMSSASEKCLDEDDLTITTVGEAESTTHRSDTDMDYTGTHLERFFEGPLTDLFQARNFEPFTDSLVVFEKVFGSQVFEISRQEIGRLKAHEPIQSMKSPSGWEGSSKTSDDGRTTVFTTCRILYDRRVTRVETIVKDPTTGKRHKYTTVTSEILKFDEDEHVETGTWCFGLCGGNQIPKDEEQPSVFEEAYEFYLYMFREFFGQIPCCYEGVDA